MPEGAHVRSVDSIRKFRSMVLLFQEEARLCLSSLELNLQKFTGWLERDRPGFWKRETERCYQAASEARVRLHQCQMRKVGDVRPTCHEEQKALQQAKRDLEHAQKQLPVVKYWHTMVHQEANEYHGRASQLVQIIERDLPRLIIILDHTIDRLEAYGNVALPSTGLQPSVPGSEDTPAADPTDADDATDSDQNHATDAADPDTGQPHHRDSEDKTP